MYGESDVIDEGAITHQNEKLLPDDVLDFKIMLEAVIQENVTLEKIVKPEEDERIAISNFIMRTTVSEIEALFWTLPQDTQERWLYGGDDDERDNEE